MNSTGRQTRRQQGRPLLAVAVAAFACGPAWPALATPATGPRIAPKVADQLKATPPVALPKPLPALPPGAGTCPDPALRGLTFKIVERTPAHRVSGRVSLIATVENVGKAEYRSRPNQQIVELYETVPGRSPRRVAAREFTNLAPGQRIDLVWTRVWNAASPAEGEFPPTYEARISYDPDIRIDGNPANDECNATNNVARLNGKSINEALRAP